MAEMQFANKLQWSHKMVFHILFRKKSILNQPPQAGSDSSVILHTNSHCKRLVITCFASIFFPFPLQK